MNIDSIKKTKPEPTKRPSRPEVKIKPINPKKNRGVNPKILLFAVLVTIFVLGLWYLSLKTNWQKIKNKPRDEPISSFEDTEDLKKQFRNIINQTSDLIDQFKNASSSTSSLDLAQSTSTKDLIKNSTTTNLSETNTSTDNLIKELIKELKVEN